MAKVELKTKKNDASVKEFLESVEDRGIRKDCKTVAAMMRRAVGKNPKMWGTGIVGFGDYHFKYESGREGDWFRIGFAPRKRNLTLYIIDGFAKYEDLMAKLGKHTKGKSCLHIKRLDDVDTDVLNDLIEESARHFEKKYGKNQAG